MLEKLHRRIGLSLIVYQKSMCLLLIKLQQTFEKEEGRLALHSIGVAFWISHHLTQLKYCPLLFVCHFSKAFIDSTHTFRCSKTVARYHLKKWLTLSNAHQKCAVASSIYYTSSARSKHLDKMWVSHNSNLKFMETHF